MGDERLDEIEAGWVQLPDEEHRFTEEETKELAGRWVVARDPSVRDVLAQLAEMEAAILALRTAEIEAKIDALLARMDADEVARG